MWKNLPPSPKTTPKGFQDIPPRTSLKSALRKKKQEKLQLEKRGGKLSPAKKPSATCHNQSQLDNPEVQSFLVWMLYLQFFRITMADLLPIPAARFVGSAPYWSKNYPKALYFLTRAKKLTWHRNEANHKNNIAKTVMFELASVILEPTCDTSQKSNPLWCLMFHFQIQKTFIDPKYISCSIMTEVAGCTTAEVDK